MGMSFRRGVAVVVVFVATSLSAGLLKAGTLFVSNTGDSGPGSLRQAIQDANPGDTIRFQIPQSDPSTDVQTIMVTTPGAEGSAFLINKDLTIDGGTAKIVVNGPGAGLPFRIFKTTGGHVTLLNLKISGGQGGEPTLGGGAIYNAADLILGGCTIIGNAGGAGAGGIENETTGTLRISNCTINGNVGYQATTAGGIENRGTLFVDNTTISGNQGNTAVGGVQNAGTAHFRNSVIAGNKAAQGSSYPDVHGTFVSDGYKFIGDVNGAGAFAGSSGFGLAGSHDQVGTHAAPADAKLSTTLQDFGGGTITMMPLPGSPLIDQGSRGNDVNG